MKTLLLELKKLVALPTKTLLTKGAMMAVTRRLNKIIWNNKMWREKLME